MCFHSRVVGEGGSKGGYVVGDVPTAYTGFHSCHTHREDTVPHTLIMHVHSEETVFNALTG